MIHQWNSLDETDRLSRLNRLSNRVPTSSGFEF